MSKLPSVICLGVAILSGAPTPAPAQPAGTPTQNELARRYAKVVGQVAAMPEDERATRLVNRAGLQLLNVLWEDTGRWEGSAVGPNISDVTIEVEMKDARGRSST